MSKNLLPDSFKKEFYDSIIKAKINELPTREQRQFALAKLVAKFQQSHKEEIAAIAKKANDAEQASLVVDEDSGEDELGPMEEVDWGSLISRLADKK